MSIHATSVQYLQGQQVHSEDIDFKAFSASLARLTRPATEEETDIYLHLNIGIPRHLPLTFDNLPKFGSLQRPSINHLTKIAIWSSRHRAGTLSEIIDAIEEGLNRPDDAWKRSIRHHLSYRTIFVKLDKTDGARGHYWALDVRRGEGYKRDRKRAASVSNADQIHSPHNLLLDPMQHTAYQTDKSRKDERIQTFISPIEINVPTSALQQYTYSAVDLHPSLINPGGSDYLSEDPPSLYFNPLVPNNTHQHSFDGFNFGHGNALIRNNLIFAYD